jgi:hypothetical protein
MIAMALTSEQAIQVARTLWPADPAPAVAWSVRRLDRPDSGYFLVVLGPEDRAERAVIVERETGRVGSSAKLQAGGSPVKVDAGRARRLAGAAESADAELVWAPSQASRSPLYPIWRVYVGSRSRYVNQQEELFETLSSVGPGGAPG